MTNLLITEAAEFLEKCGDAGQWSDGDGEGKAQIENLQKWCRTTGSFVEYKPPAGAPLDGGSEHELFYDPIASCVCKCTSPPGTFGLVGFGQKLERIATPYFYLRRLALANRAFDSGINLEGVTAGEKPSIVTTLLFYRAADLHSPHPTTEEVAIYMYGQGFEPARNVRDSWSRELDGLIVLDTRSANFIKTIEGIVPIDLVLKGGHSGMKVEQIAPASDSPCNHHH